MGRNPQSSSDFKLQLAIEEAMHEAAEKMRNTPTIHVVIADTLEQGKAFKQDHRCSRCYDKVRYFSVKSPPRGQLFDDVNYIHVLTDNPELWRDILLTVKFSKKFSGPIWTYFQRK